MYKFKIPIGDWSDDGHEKCEEYTVECNHGVEEVRQGYKDSCKLTGVQFNHNEDYTGRLGKYEYKSWRQIATEYGDNEVNKQVIGILKEHNIDFDLSPEEGEEGYSIQGSEEFLYLLMAFIKLSITDLEYKVVGDGLPYLNGYWNKELNVQFGYGLFE